MVRLLLRSVIVFALAFATVMPMAARAMPAQGTMMVVPACLNHDCPHPAKGRSSKAMAAPCSSLACMGTFALGGTTAASSPIVYAVAYPQATNLLPFGSRPLPVLQPPRTIALT